MFKINSIQKRILKDKIEPYIYLFPFMFFLLIFTIYPVINVFLLSCKENYSFLRGTYDGISFENYKEVLADEECFTLKQLAVNGNDLINMGITEGKMIGSTLKLLLSLVIDEKVENTRGALLDKAKEIVRNI